MVDLKVMGAGTLVGGRYRLTRQIGEGAMGVVWAAVNEATSREVAIKLISKSTANLRHRLMREAKACGSLSHRNIIEVLDVGQTKQGDPFLVMPLLQGETLKELLDRQFRLEVPFAAQIARDVAKALSAAHAANIIHRDLKPANIYLHQEPGTEGLVVKVLDFGVSKNLSAQETVATMVGAVGSLAYMSPEQLKSPRDVDPRADLWSLGVVLFEMLCGRRPFQGEAQEVMTKILSGDVPRLSKYVRNVEPTLVALVSHCLQVDRGRRIRSAEELAKLLNGYAGAEETSRIFAEMPARGSSPSIVDAEPSRSSVASAKELHQGRAAAASTPPPMEAPGIAAAGSATERVRPEVLAELAKQPRWTPAPAPSSSSVPVSETPPSNALFAGATAPLPVQSESPRRDSSSSISPTLSSPQSSAPGTATERLDPAQYIAALPTPVGGREDAPVTGKGTLVMDGGRRSQSKTGSEPPKASERPSASGGGTLKIPLDTLPHNSPLPPAPTTGITTSTAPLLQTARPGSDSVTGAPPTSSGSGARPERARASRTAALGVIAALALVIGAVGTYGLVFSSPKSALPDEQGAAPSVLPSSSPSLTPPPVIETAPPVVSPPASAEPIVEPTPTVVPSPSANPTPTSSVLQAPPKPPPRSPRPDPYAPTPKCGKLITKDCPKGAPPSPKRYNPIGF